MQTLNQRRQAQCLCMNAMGFMNRNGELKNTAKRLKSEPPKLKRHSKMKILLATDGSESAQAAVDCLIRFPFPSDSEVTMLTVIDRDVFKNEERE